RGEVGGDDRQLLALRIGVEEVEEVVAYDRAADGEARLQRVLGAEALRGRQTVDRRRAGRGPALLAEVREDLTVDVVRAALGDGVHGRPNAAAVLRVVVRADDLELLDGGL